MTDCVLHLYVWIVINYIPWHCKSILIIVDSNSSVSCLSLMYCIILTVRRHALIVHMLIKTLPARAGTYFGLYCTVADCNENLTCMYIKKAHIFSCRSVTPGQLLVIPGEFTPRVYALAGLSNCFCPSVLTSWLGH